MKPKNSSMRYLVIITMLLPDYAEDIVYQLVQAGFEVSNGCVAGLPSIVNYDEHSVSTILVLCLSTAHSGKDEYDNPDVVSKVITDALIKTSAKYYSVIIIPDRTGPLVINGNIRIKKSKNVSNTIKLVPKLKDPTKLETPPDNIIE